MIRRKESWRCEASDLATRLDSFSHQPDAISQLGRQQDILIRDVIDALDPDLGKSMSRSNINLCTFWANILGTGRDIDKKRKILYSGGLGDDN